MDMILSIGIWHQAGYLSFDVLLDDRVCNSHFGPSDVVFKLSPAVLDLSFGGDIQKATQGFSSFGASPDAVREENQL